MQVEQYNYQHLDKTISRLQGDIKGEIVCLEIHQTIKQGIVDIIDRMADNLRTEITETISGREEN